MAGGGDYSEEQRLTLLRTAIAQGAEYVDLEWDVALQVRRYGATKRVVSYHNFQETPANLPAIWEKMRALIRTSSRSPRWPTP